MADHLCPACKAHHDRVRELLADLGIAWEDTPTLVRGLDYYTRTTYEFDHPLLGAQSGIGGGGRYDGLSEDIGGPPLPGIGFGLGLDRTILALDAESQENGGVAFAAKPRCGRSASRSATPRNGACSGSSPACAAPGSPPTWRSAARG